jgi:hypothetical protein
MLSCLPCPIYGLQSLRLTLHESLDSEAVRRIIVGANRNGIKLILTLFF